MISLNFRTFFVVMSLFLGSLMLASLCSPLLAESRLIVQPAASATLLDTPVSQQTTPVKQAEVRETLPKAKRTLLQSLHEKLYWGSVLATLALAPERKRISLENQFLYNPQPPSELNAEQKAHEVFLKGAAGKQPDLRLLYYPPAKANGKMLVYFGGNAEQLLDGYKRTAASGWLKAGHGFVSTEYPGYGLSMGQTTPSQERFFAAADRVATFLSKEKNIPPNQQVAVGYSLGTAVATHYASMSKEPVKALFLVAPFASIPAMVDTYRQEAGLPAWWFKSAGGKISQPLNSQAAIAKVIAPVYFFHGTVDTKCPLGQSELLKLAAVNASKVSLTPFEGIDHEGILKTDYPEQILQLMN
jgi:pimeloyl-ACP methyl ester carboxylesterase